jgi:hypothetical protein
MGGAGMIIAVVTGCSGSSMPAAGHGATTAPTTVPAVATAVPVLGRPAGVFAHGEGFGQVKPARIFNGGDPTGLVTHLAWSSWGGARATGTGLSDYVGQGQTVASGTQQRVTVVAFRLGRCHGTLMYRAVEWYFPGEGQSFDPTHYENVCSGTYVPHP